ncbi:helix-turn-helix domain-containing protein [Nonomuraea phyllanthi]|uniref:Helix-turn-helix domain-containing protein n=1 Tax=Nonomuraea phyllanthi TaxID=2219224 RepID=A0A5C4V6A8_9ACTN|nr:helix-turn-helix transcriptional regulator [Nonomuraea phyllanthi]KAB8186930.1 helix-turn-helix domain-containing protein [Nonomuraea phyllanthi]
MKPVHPIVAALKQAREDRGWTQAELARRLWKTPEAVAFFENSPGSRKLASVEEVAALFGMRLALVPVVDDGVDLDALADDMILPACRLVPAVHDEDPDEVANIIGAMGVMELRALAVVLASLVPADDPALGLFTQWREDGPGKAAGRRRLMLSEVAAWEQGKREAS